MGVTLYTNNTSIDQGFLDSNGNPVIIAPGKSKYLEQWTLMPTNTNNLMVITDYDGAGNILYRGFARPGTGSGQAGWAIFRRVGLGGNDSVDRWVQGENPPKMKYVWDNRLTYTYA